MSRLSRFLTWDSHSPQYNLYRYASSLLYYGIYRPLNPRTPNFTPSATRRIAALLHDDMVVFEWGSGRSTPWYAARVDRLVSVEHSPKWHAIGVGSLKQLGIRNTELILAAPTPGDGFDWEHDWPFYGLVGHAPAGSEFLGYMSAIDRFPDASFDCISIDGRGRLGCLVHAIPKLAGNGFLVLDDSQRPRYAECFHLLADWNVENHRFGQRRTTLFWRPGVCVPD